MAKVRKKGKVSYGDNLYEIHGSYWLKFTYKGKTYHERIGRVDEMPLTMARNIAIKIKQEIIQGTYLPVEEKGLNFKELAQEYLRWYHSTRPHAKAMTSYEIERKTHKLVDYFGTMELSKISTFTIEQYKQHRLSAGVKPNTINSELNILRAILKKAKALKLYSGDLPEVKLFKVDDSRLRFLKPEEFARLLQACPSWLRPAVEFAVYTGLRASEIFSLKWEDVDLEHGTIAITNAKNNEIARLPLGKQAIELLKRLKGNTPRIGYIFTNSKGKPYKVEDKTYLKAFKTACRKAGMPDLRFHDLRHTFASWLAMKGVDLYTIQHLTRHKSANMVKRYAHLSPEHLRSALDTLSEVIDKSFPKS